MPFPWKENILTSHDAFLTIQTDAKRLLSAEVPDSIPPTDCDLCGKRLSQEEYENPVVRDGDTLCDDCETEHYKFTCSWCEDYKDQEVQHRYIVVFDAQEAGVDLAGLYRIDAYPYYTSGLIGSSWLHPGAVTWLGFLATLTENLDGFPCGHLCQACQTRALKEIAYETRCMAHAVR